MRIGLVPGSFKPYHAGHDALVRIALNDNDIVMVFYSTSAKRDGISGSATAKIIKDYVKNSLPSNVEMIPVEQLGLTPVGAVFKELEQAEKTSSADTYTIYSDEDDIKNYSENKLIKYAPNLIKNDQIKTVGIKRGTMTPDISGTQMRTYLMTGNVEGFISMLPLSIQQHGQEIFDKLKGSLSESLLKKYIRDTLENLT